MKRCIFLLLMLLPLPVLAQNGSITGYCVQGATSATVQGLNSTNKLQGVVQSCTVSVYLTGTVTLATLTTATGGATSNPFTASVTGQWIFYAAAAQGYDVVLSGGIAPNTYASPITLTSLFPQSSTVNSQCNVLTAGAKGDCVTDDQAPIQACLNKQLTSTPQITVYFPAPPGGCYKTSRLTMTGASLQGQAGSGFVGQPGAGVILQGLPSQDVLWEPDPNTPGSVAVRAGWAIQDMVIKVDDSVDASASFPHRWPGKWVQDGAINASSHSFTSIYAEFTCGDIGQNILVKGAGSPDLSTTIATVSPCWNNGTEQITATATTVPLTAAAGTTVTNALTYITPANIPVTQHVGNCGLAGDNFDGNSANWVMTGNPGNFQPRLWNVTFTSTNQTNSHNECAVYFQGAWVPYFMDAKNVWVWNMEWGITQGLSDTNPALGDAGQDFQKWDHGWLYAKYPWISYNQGFTTLTDIQLTAGNGLQILQVKSTAEQAPNNWNINIPEFESATGVGYRIDGYQSTVINTELCGGKTASINTINSRFIQSNCGGTFDLNGSNNWLDGALIPKANIPNNGMDNIYDGAQLQGSSGMVATVPQTQTLNRGRQAWGTLTPDFIRNGTAPYYNDHDLWIWPEDFTDIFGYDLNVVADANAWGGNYAVIPVSGFDLFYYNTMYMLGRSVTNCNPSGPGGNCNQLYAGQNFPAGKVLVEFSYKCPSITTFNATIRAYGGGTTVGGPTATSCSTSYATQTITADFTSYSGQAFDLNISAGEVDIAWMAIKPLGTLNAVGITGGGSLTIQEGPAANALLYLNYGLTHKNVFQNNYAGGTVVEDLGGGGIQIDDQGNGGIVIDPTGAAAVPTPGTLTLGGIVIPAPIFSHAGHQLPGCAAGTIGTAWVSDATSLTTGTAYSVSAGAGAVTVQVECTHSGSTYAWQTM